MPETDHILNLKTASSRHKSRLSETKNQNTKDLGRGLSEVYIRANMYACNMEICNLKM